MPLLTADYAPAASRFAQHLRTYGQAVTILCDGATQAALEDAGKLMDATVPVDTGALKRSRTRSRRRGKLRWQLDYPLPYAPILEYGGFRGIGPRTIHAGPADLGAGFQAPAGIYSKQAPLGWVRRALVATEKPWHERIHNAIRQAWTGEVRTVADESALAGNLSEIFGVDISL